MRVNIEVVCEGQGRFLIHERMRATYMKPVVRSPGGLVIDAAAVRIDFSTSTRWQSSLGTVIIWEWHRLWTVSALSAVRQA